jgi:ribose transport system substrate-binding protein
MCKNIEQAITMKPDVIVIMHVDNVMEGESVKLAYEAGIPVVWDTGRPADDYQQYGICYNGVDDIMAGEVAAQMMNDMLGGKGNIVSITGIPGQLTTEDRNEGFTNKMKELNSEIKVIGTNTGEWSKETAYQVMSDFLTRYGDTIDGVFAHDDEQASGAAQAIADAGYDLKDFVITGIGGSKTGLQYIKDGMVDGTTYQSPRTTMTLTIEAVQYILDNGLKAGEQMDPFWRWIELPAVTAENVDQFLPGEW